MVQTSTTSVQQEEQGNSNALTPPFPKDCKSCGGAVHLLESYKHMALRRKQEQASSQTSPSPQAQQQERAQASQQHSTPTPQGSADYGAYGLQCPPDSSELGRATWTFLHTMAAAYPDEPSRSQQTLMRNIIDGVAEFYPCTYCRSHFQLQVDSSPPDTSSSSALSLWLCRMHNEVNELLGKPTFDCSKALQRWRDGPPDGACD